MVYLLVHPLSGEAVMVQGLEDAKAAAIELDTFFFYPRKSFISTEVQKLVVILENGIWQTKKLKEIKCNCHSNH